MKQSVKLGVSDLEGLKSKRRTGVMIRLAQKSCAPPHEILSVIALANTAASDTRQQCQIAMK